MEDFNDKPKRVWFQIEETEGSNSVYSGVGCIIGIWAWLIVLDPVRLNSILCLILF